MIPEGVREWWRGWGWGEEERGKLEIGKEVEVGVEGFAVVKGEEGEVYDHGVREAEERNEREDASELIPVI